MNLQSIKQRFGIIGISPALDNALSTAIRVANTDLSVLITGESGVGKEVFSKIIHSMSNRKHNKLIAVNCGAIPEGTINSELFGHTKGAFTGATSDRKGYFETVNGGTIFLDEIGEMPLDTQTFLLRVLESGEFIRVGASKMQTTDVRVIAATNVTLEQAIDSKKFREDLFYRLSTVPIQVPPLRERQEDIYLLFRKFAVDFAEQYKRSPIKLDAQAQAILENYNWPGNIRELKNVAEQLSVLSEDKIISAQQLADQYPKIIKRDLPSVVNNKEDKSSFEEREILYKLLFDMKGDLNDLKKVISEIVQRNNLDLPNQQDIQILHNSLPDSSKERTSYSFEESNTKQHTTPTVFEYNDDEKIIDSKPIILSSEHSKDTFHPTEEVIENLSLEEMEKDYINKALKKHRGKRREASKELGISERTLYRKIKQYDIQE